MIRLRGNSDNILKRMEPTTMVAAITAIEKRTTVNNEIR